MTKKRILITGASGFLGSHLVEAALESGFEVYAGIRSTSNKQFLRQPDIHFYEMDFFSERQLSAVLKGGPSFDFVIHNAGITAANRKSDFYRVNGENTRNLIAAFSGQAQVPERFVLISSLAVYGPGNSETFAPIRPGDSNKPISTYAKSKLMGEQVASQAKKFPVQIIQPAAIYGPRDKDFLTYFRMVQNRFEPMIGGYRQMLSMIYAKDLANGVMHLLEKPLVRTKYIVSDGNDYDKKDLGRLTRKIMDKKTLRLTVPLPLLLPFISLTEKIYSSFGRLPFLHREKILEISSPNWLCDSSDFWKDAGIRAEFDLEKGLVQTAEWYKQQGWI